MAVKALLCLMALMVLALMVSARQPFNNEMKLGGKAAALEVTGVVHCSDKASKITAKTPAFSNANVQLMCAGSVIQSTTTSATGEFSMSVPPNPLFSALTKNCKLAVTTPLSQCDPSLSNKGILSSPLNILGVIIKAFIKIFNIKPFGFNLV